MCHFVQAPQSPPFARIRIVSIYTDMGLSKTDRLSSAPRVHLTVAHWRCASIAERRRRLKTSGDYYSAHTTSGKCCLWTSVSLFASGLKCSPIHNETFIYTHLCMKEELLFHLNCPQILELVDLLLLYFSSCISTPSRLQFFF